MWRKAFALFRAAALNAASYRLGGVLSIGTLLIQFAPTYFVAHALQPAVNTAIATDGGDFFGYLVFGLAAILLMRVGLEALPRAVENGLSTGTFEALICTPVGLPALVVGLTLYDFLWALVNVVVLLGLAAVLGLHFTLTRFPLGLVLFLSIAVAYFGFGMMAAALALWVRRSAPLRMIITVSSIFLGGVTYPAAMIPERFRPLTALVPVTYPLRAARRVLLQGASISDVAPDLVVTFAVVVGLLALGSLSLTAAVAQSRRAGTLTQY